MVGESYFFINTLGLIPTNYSMMNQTRLNLSFRRNQVFRERQLYNMMVIGLIVKRVKSFTFGSLQIKREKLRDKRMNLKPEGTVGKEEYG